VGGLAGVFDDVGGARGRIGQRQDGARGAAIEGAIAGAGDRRRDERDDSARTRRRRGWVMDWFLIWKSVGMGAGGT
jgi:hypothetical protein